MKYILSIVAAILVSLTLVGSVSTTSAGFFTNEKAEIPYCNDGGDCGLKEGVDAIKKIDGLVTDEKASTYIQKIVKYVLGFLALLATLIIIYAGFNLLTGVGDEEKAKKTKQIIIYAIVGLVIIYLAGPITNFILKILNG